MGGTTTEIILQPLPDPENLSHYVDVLTAQRTMKMESVEHRMTICQKSA